MLLSVYIHSSQTNETCYNCHRTGHRISDCPLPTSLQQIQWQNDNPTRRHFTQQHLLMPPPFQQQLLMPPLLQPPPRQFNEINRQSPLRDRRILMPPNLPIPPPFLAPQYTQHGTFYHNVPQFNEQRNKW